MSSVRKPRNSRVSGTPLTEPMSYVNSNNQHSKLVAAKDLSRSVSQASTARESNSPTLH